MVPRRLVPQHWVPVWRRIFLDFRSVMGVTVPIVEFQGESNVKPDYGFGNTSVELDKAFGEFYGVLEFVAELARARGLRIRLHVTLAERSVV